jgi:hypothetical protein
MTKPEATRIVSLLDLAFATKERRRPDALEMMADLIAELDDYELASKAAKTIISEHTFFPRFAEFRRAYLEHAAAKRRNEEQAELKALLAEPTNEERQHQLRQMRAWVETRWPRVAA